MPMHKYTLNPLNITQRAVLYFFYYCYSPRTDVQKERLNKITAVYTGYMDDKVGLTCFHLSNSIQFKSNDGLRTYVYNECCSSDSFQYDEIHKQTGDRQPTQQKCSEVRSNRSTSCGTLMQKDAVANCGCEKRRKNKFVKTQLISNYRYR